MQQKLFTNEILASFEHIRGIRMKQKTQTMYDAD